MSDGTILKPRSPGNRLLRLRGRAKTGGASAPHAPAFCTCARATPPALYLLLRFPTPHRYALAPGIRGRKGMAWAAGCLAHLLLPSGKGSLWPHLLCSLAELPLSVEGRQEGKSMPFAHGYSRDHGMRQIKLQSRMLRDNTSPQTEHCAKQVSRQHGRGRQTRRRRGMLSVATAASGLCSAWRRYLESHIQA